MNLKDVMMEFEMFIKDTIYPEKVSKKLAKVLKAIAEEMSPKQIRVMSIEEYIHILGVNEGEYTIKNLFFLFNSFTSLPFSFFKDKFGFSIEDYSQLYMEQQLHVKKWNEIVQPKRAELNRKFEILKKSNMTNGRQEIKTSLDLEN